MSDSQSRGPDGGRQHPRYDVDWRVTLKCPDWHHAGRVAASNASRQGMFLLTSRPPKVGTSVELTILLPNGQELTLRGRVLAWPHGVM